MKKKINFLQIPQQLLLIRIPRDTRTRKLAKKRGFTQTTNVLYSSYTTKLCLALFNLSQLETLFFLTLDTNKQLFLFAIFDTCLQVVKLIRYFFIFCINECTLALLNYLIFCFDTFCYHSLFHYPFGVRERVHIKIIIHTLIHKKIFFFSLESYRSRLFDNFFYLSVSARSAVLLWFYFSLRYDNGRG